MRRSPKVLLADAVDAAESIGSFVCGATLDDFLNTRMLRSAVERELLTIGEALNALDTACPDARKRITELGRVIGLRNRLAHGYDTIDDTMIWFIAFNDIPLLHAEIRSWLDDIA